jgi:hypothetical protein
VELAEQQLQARPAIVSTTVNDASRNAAESGESIVLDAMPDERLREALSSLPERYRQAVLLYDVEGFSCREIARTIGVPLGNGDVTSTSRPCGAEGVERRRGACRRRSDLRMSYLTMNRQRHA